MPSHTIAEQAVKADELVDEAKAAGGGNHPVTVHAKMLRLELLKVKADLERELEDFVLDCSNAGLDVHWVSGLGVSPGHWAHREPAPHGEPAVEVHQWRKPTCEGARRAFLRYCRDPRSTRSLQRTNDCSRLRRIANRLRGGPDAPGGVGRDVEGDEAVVRWPWPWFDLHVYVEPG
jgi:hypothetical protein